MRTSDELSSGEAGPTDKGEENNEEDGLDRGRNPESTQPRSIVEEEVAVAKHGRRRQNCSHFPRSKAPTPTHAVRSGGSTKVRSSPAPCRTGIRPVPCDRVETAR